MQATQPITALSHQLTGAAPERLILSLRAPQEREVELSQGNIPKRAGDLIRLITESNLFTPEQKTFTGFWEGHFIRLLSHENQLLPAKAVCFLGMKVITPALAQYADNCLMTEKLIPLVQAQRELLALLLPEKADVEGFIIQCEEVYDLMKETILKLNDIIAMNQETERLIGQTATGIRERILSISNQSREMLRELAQQWRFRIGAVTTKLTQLTEKADALNRKSQEHSHELEVIGVQLAAENRVFLEMVEDLKHLLGKV